MRKEIELVLYEIKYSIFPKVINVSFEEYILIEEAVMKHKKKYPLELLESYLSRWSKLIL